MPQSPERLLINKCLHLSRDCFNRFTLSAPVAVKCFLRLLSYCFPSLARCVGLNTGLGNNQSAFSQTKMLCKLRCREETLLSSSGNILFKERHENITAILVEAGLWARCVQYPAIFTGPATVEQTSKFAWLVDLLQACPNRETRGWYTKLPTSVFLCFPSWGSREIAQLQEVNVCWSHSETCASSKLWG